ncbi:MAG: hypothetical protein HZA59_11215 [Hydrogenophilales bacterium]|nr:hypothetical protein [Hydrogenophilales bacterium]
MYTWTRILFVIAALYEGLLGLAFLFLPLAIFAWYGVEPPNHPAYVQFSALLLLIFAAMFMRIASNPTKNHDLIPYGIALKASYVGLTFWYITTTGIPSMWVPWAWADLVFLIVFLFAWVKLRRT